MLLQTSFNYLKRIHCFHCNSFRKRIILFTILAAFGYAFLRSLTITVGHIRNYWLYPTLMTSITQNKGCHKDGETEKSNIAMFIVFDLKAFKCTKSHSNNTADKSNKKINRRTKKINNSDNRGSNNRNNNSVASDIRRFHGNIEHSGIAKPAGNGVGGSTGNENKDKSECDHNDGTVNTDPVWSVLESFVAECQRHFTTSSTMISSSSFPRRCPVYAIFYAEDKLAPLIRRLLHQRLSRVSDDPSSSVQASQSFPSDVDKIQRQQRGAVDLVVQLLPNRMGDVRAINGIVREEYLNSGQYFVVMQATMFNLRNQFSGNWRATNSGTLRKMINALGNHPSPFLDAGIAVATTSSEIHVGTFFGTHSGTSYGTSSGTSSGSSSASVLVFSRIHLEIFGSSFPHQKASFSEALAAVTSAGLYPRNITHWYNVDGEELEGMEGPEGVSGEDIAGGRVQRRLGTGTRSPQTVVDLKSLWSVVEGLRNVSRMYFQAVKAKPCLRSNISASRSVISMCLYGTDRRYTMGAIRNAELLPVIYPGWRLRFYCETPTADGKTKHGVIPPDIIAKIKELGAEIKYVDANTSRELAPMLWRFQVAWDPEVEIFIVRDCDSRLTPRDATVVADWLKTDKAFHCIRDHPYHASFPILGGLWGGRRAKLDAIFGGTLMETVKSYRAGYYMEDMDFLRLRVWPKVKDRQAYCHDSFSCDRYESSHAFPVVREGLEHLGGVYDEFSVLQVSDKPDTVMSGAFNAKCVPSAS